MEMKCVVCVVAGCKEIWGEVAGEDELVHDADVMRAVADAA